jgi:hypothetical protein
MNSSESQAGELATLATIHSNVNGEHERTRMRLLQLLNDDRLTPLQPAPQLLMRRWAWGGLIAGMFGALAIGVWFVMQASPAKAMERMVKALEQINAYSYRMEKTYISRKGEGRTVQQITTGNWQTTPAAMQAQMLIHETLATNTVMPETPTTLANIEEAHEAGRPGILIDHLKREYWTVNDPMDANSIPPGSPQVAVYMVQQRRGRVVRDLGQKDIAGQIANGLEIVLDNAQPVSELGSTVSETADGEPKWDWRNMTFEVWIDPKTDLPIEFRCERRGEDFETTYVFTALNWNVEFGEGEFDLGVPDGYRRASHSRAGGNPAAAETEFPPARE